MEKRCNQLGAENLGWNLIASWTYEKNLLIVKLILTNFKYDNTLLLVLYHDYLV